jgi:hypothetical protein
VIGAGGLWKFGEEPREVGIWLGAASLRRLEGLARPETGRRAAQDLLLGTSNIRLSDSSRANELGLVDGGQSARAVDGV